jgi:altronate hydrolase
MSSSSDVDVIVLHAADSVAVAAHDLQPGATVRVADVQVPVVEAVPFGHKIATRRIKVGDRVTKYGQTIGFATQLIEAGQWVHSHNLCAGEFGRDYQYATQTPPDPPPLAGRTFMGYRRANGKAGTRNYIVVISSVNCSASVAKHVAGHFDREALKDYPNIDGVIALTHKGGCAMQPGGLEHTQLTRVLSGFAKHANIGGCVLIGLGCETGSTTHLMCEGELVGDTPTLVMQDIGGTAKTVELGIQHVGALVAQVNAVARVPIPAGELIVGLECGGSDGNSGITANPALGAAADLIVAAGGTVILSETPEIYGAEHLLARRAVSQAVGRKLIDLIEWWQKYTEFFGVKIDHQLSPGNKQGGMTTIYEKSLGAIAKAGSTALREVYRYAEPVTSKGLVVMDSPGYDPASVTGMIAGGATVVCFTTGRGSCFGCKPTPSIKIASNTPMYERMIDDMDINAGVVYEAATVPQVGRQIFELILEVAGGRKTRSEMHGIGEEEFVPWSIGPTL